jgi:hypothetical protein
VADGGVVVLAGDDHEPVISRRKRRVTAPSVIRGHVLSCTVRASHLLRRVCGGTQSEAFFGHIDDGP